MNLKVIIQNLLIFYYLFLSLVAPITGDVGISSHRTMYTNLMKKNLSLFSETEIGFFLSFKESQYSLRRERIEEYCSKRDQKFGKKIVKSSLIYDDVDGVSYCQIAKVASSSWCNHFIKLGKLDLFWSMLGCLTIKYWTNLQWVYKKYTDLNNIKVIQSIFSANVSDRTYRRYRDALQMLAPQLWPPPEKECLSDK